jgi:hypothetical protein
MTVDVTVTPERNEIRKAPPSVGKPSSSDKRPTLADENKDVDAATKQA